MIGITMTTIIYTGMTMTAPIKTTVSMTTTKTMDGGDEKTKLPRGIELVPCAW